jgi:hypothetical protein
VDFQDDTAGCPVLVYTASPAVDMHKPKGACNEPLSVDTVHNQTAHMGEEHSEQFVHTEQVAGPRFQLFNHLSKQPM